MVDAPLPTAGRGEVRVRVLASSLNYTEVLIRRHLYPQTMRLRPPFVMGYDVVGRSISSPMACATIRLATAWPT